MGFLVCPPAELSLSLGRVGRSFRSKVRTSWRRVGGRRRAETPSHSQRFRRFRAPQPTQARSLARGEVAKKNGDIQLQTLWWRAPEILFGDLEFGTAADMWSCGLVFAEMAGCPFHKSHKNKLSLVKALVKQLGAPVATSLAALPQYPPGLTASAKTPWPAEAFEIVGSPGLELLDFFLAWEPTSRATAAEALKHCYFGQGHFAIVGPASCKGKRHDWNMLAANMPHDALMWLRADPALTKDGLKSLNLNFDMANKRTKSEAGRKIILAGYSHTPPATKQMCNLSLASPLPLERFGAWAAAFRAVNADSLAELESQAKRAVSRMNPKEIGDNGQHFVDTPLLEWFATCGELCLSAPVGSDVATCWSEPEHCDGGASIVHMGVTWFGRRELVCQQGSDLPPITLTCLPGSVYVGGLTGPVHQVHHQVPRAGESLRGSGVATGPGFDEGLSVTIMCRTALFPHNQARLRNTTPSPPCVFYALAESFRSSFAALPFRLPTLPEILQAAERALTPRPLEIEPAGLPSSKRPRL